MLEKDLQKYRNVQNIAKQTMNEISKHIETGVTEADIAYECERIMREKGIESFWYHDVAALVLVGERTTLSVSGRKYKPAKKKVKETDLVTIDLSPQIDGFWGDYARSFFVMGGKLGNYLDYMEDFSSSGAEKFHEIAQGMRFEGILHQVLMQNARPKMNFRELYLRVNAFIENFGYVNLDFHGNLGHSIVKQKDDRVYIDNSNREKLSSVPLFTFEPHFRKKGGSFGFKQEDIYYFENGRLKVL